MASLFASCVPMLVKKLLNLLSISILSDVVDTASVMREIIDLVEGVLFKIEFIVVHAFFISFLHLLNILVKCNCLAFLIHFLRIQLHVIRFIRKGGNATLYGSVSLRRLYNTLF